MAKDTSHGWIDTVPPEQATGLLAKLYKAAILRAGRVFNVLRVQSLRPKILRVSTPPGHKASSSSQISGGSTSPPIR